VLLIETVKDMQNYVKEARRQGKTVGLVPTMGYLHEGHLSLVSRSAAENDVTVVSVFVNPTQFGPNEDFDRYPRDLQRDMGLVEPAGATVVFHPTPEEMYPMGQNSLYVDTNSAITGCLCGEKRPGHFRGVMTVVSKLFTIVRPDRAYFGQKDAQQVAVIQRMVKELFLDLTIVPCPIIREEDGLAKSSRNIYLGAEERQQALVLSRSLFKAEAAVKAGERDAQVILKLICDTIAEAPLGKLDYAELRDAETLETVTEIRGRVLAAIAVQFPGARLIDNIILEG